MKNSLDCKKLLSYGKELSIFAGILLVLLFMFSCNNILMRNSGSLIIALPGARATTASLFTIELTGSNGTIPSEPLAGGTTVQFDDLAPDTYTINVKGMDDTGTIVLSGTAKATVVAGETETVTVDLKSSLGNLTVSFEGAESDSVAKYTVILSGPNESKETQEVTARTALFEGLIPGDYTVSVEGKNGDVVVLAGTPSKVTVEAGKTKSVIVELQKLLGSLTVNFEGADDSTDTSFTFELTDLEGKTISDGSSSQFDNLAPGTYNVVVKGTQNNVLVFYGTTRENVKPSENTTATVPLIKGVSDFAGLQAAVAAGGTVYIFESIDVSSVLTVGTTVEILPAYQDVTLKNIGSENLFTVGTNGNLTIGGGEYTITLDGNQVAQSIISVSGGTATLADNGIITNAAASGIKISSPGTFEMTGGEISKNKSSAYNEGGGITISGGIFNMTGGRIIDNTGLQSSGGVTVSSAKFNMTGGTITDNTGSFGGAVSLVSGTFDMSGGSITGNTVTSSGGGVSVSGGEFKLSGGSITGNSAKNDGDGVYMSSNGVFNMSGSAVVDSNNDVYLITGKTINITSTLTGTAPVATITPPSYSADTQVLSLGNYTSEVSKFALTPDPAGSQWTISETGFLQKVASDFASLENAISAGGTVYITKAITMERTLDINKEVTLLSTTQSVVLTGPNSGNLFTVSTGGDLTIGDADHAITLDGNKKSSQIISVDDGGIVTLANGTITNANASGVYINAGGTFNMTGGSIIGNATSNGGGVYVNTGATFTMSGSAVVDVDNDVYLSANTTIFVSGDLSGGDTVAKITPHTYDINTGDGVSVLSGSIDSSICDKFTVTTAPDYSTYKVGTTGKLEWTV